MAITGLSKPIVAKYANEGTTVTYSDVLAVEKAVEYSVEIDAADNNDFYGDNGVAETANGRFSKGTLTLQTTDFTPKLSAAVLGVKTLEQKRSVGEKKVNEVVFDDDIKPTVLGYGIIEEHQINNVRGYLPVVFPKVTFNIPSRSATTRGETIEWQTPEITGTVMRSDQVDEDYNRPWQISPEEMMETEADAENYIKAVFGQAVGMG